MLDEACRGRSIHVESAEHGIYKTMSNYGAVHQIYWNGAFIGLHIRVALDCMDEIVTEFEYLLKDIHSATVEARDASTVASEEEIEEEFTFLFKIMQQFQFSFPLFWQF